MKSAFVVFVFACCLSLTVRAHYSPDFFSFQGVARDAAGHVVADKDVSLRISIHTLLNPPSYTEVHHRHTNAHGIFNIFIGTGEASLGEFKDIVWNSGVYFLKIEIDPAGGSNYIDLGSTQLASVPYAHNSKYGDFASASGRWQNNIPIVHRSNMASSGELPLLTSGASLIWHPRKASFRAGLITNDSWDESNNGTYSTSFGRNNKAIGSASFAAGDENNANGVNATSFGYQNESRGESSFSVGKQNLSKGPFSATLGTQNFADGVAATATGINTDAIGDASFSTGVETFAKAFASATFGAFNNVQDNPVGATITDARDFDRIFQIGNGGGAADLSNALTVLRDGKIGIGNGAVLPQFILDIDGRPRIRHKVETAGIFFDDSDNKPNAFVGMRNNSEVGFYLGSDWRFYVNAGGGATLIGALDQVSDRRLKKDFSVLTNSLNKISQVSGYHYRWTNKKLSNDIQTGLIAQEIEAIFPELVSTNAEGYKAVNYIGLIPHLIESVKDLKAENEELKRALTRLNSLEASLNELLKKNANQPNTQKEVR